MDKQKVINKIQALLSKTVENGASEAESIAAMEKAQKLMNEYDIAMSQVQGQDEKELEVGKVIVDTRKSRSPKYKEAIVLGVSKLTDTICWVDRGSSVRYIFFGTEESTTYAQSLYGLLIQAIENELNAYKATSEYKENKTHATTKCNSFRESMAYRLRERMNEIKRASEVEKQEAVQETGIVLYNKKDMVQKAFDDAGINLRKGTAKKASKRDNEAAEAGRKAAERYEFNKNITTKNDKGHRVTRKFLK